MQQMPEGEMRVTVIATGLVDDRIGGGRDVTETRVDDRSNVTQLRREPPPLEPPSVSAEQPLPPPEPASQPQPAASAEFISPFEDELDVPTFLRNPKEGSDDEEEERTRPAFLRRSAD